MARSEPIRLYLTERQLRELQELISLNILIHQYVCKQSGCYYTVPGCATKRMLTTVKEQL